MIPEFSAVIADPDADAPRRAAAARLEERGDPRGRFITIQLEMAAERRARGGSREYWWMDDGAEALLARHRAAWEGEIEGLAREPRFQRGFIEGVTLEAAEFLARGAELYARAPIRHVRLQESRAVLAELMASPLLGRLAALGLAASALDDEAIETLAASPHLGKLRLLDLSFNAIGPAGLEALAAAPALRRLIHLNLVGNPCDDPVETYGVDGMTGWLVPGTEALPEAGRKLEARHGDIAWLHAPSRLVQYPPGEADV